MTQLILETPAEATTLRVANVNLAPAPRGTCLVVGLSPDHLDVPGLGLSGSALQPVENPAALSQTLVRANALGQVVAPLFTPDFDVLDLAERLVDLGFRGTLTVICPPLPDRALVAREIAAQAPGIQVELQIERRRTRRSHS